MILRMSPQNSRKKLIQLHGDFLIIQMLKMTEKLMILLIQLDKLRSSSDMQKKIETGTQTIIGITILITQRAGKKGMNKMLCMLKMDQKEKAQNILTGGRD